MLILIRIASPGEAILMSTHNIFFMENWWKLSFNYHQIPILSVPLIISPKPSFNFLSQFPWNKMWWSPKPSYFFLPQSDLSRLVTKPTKWVCAQRRFRSAWASAQSDQSLRCPHEESLGPWLPTERTAKTLIRLGRCPGWSESSLGTHSLCWFCHVAAHLCFPSLRLVQRIVSLTV